MNNDSAPRGQHAGDLAAMQAPAIPSPELDKRRAINGREAANLVGVTLRTLRRYAELGFVPGAYRVGTGHWRYKRRELLDRWARLDRSNVLRSQFQRRRSFRSERRAAMSLSRGVRIGLRHADRWRVENMLREQSELGREDEERDFGLWLRLFEPDDRVRIGEVIREASAASPDELCWGCTWGHDGVPKNAVGHCASARELLRGESHADAMTHREVCEAVIGRMRAEGAPILLVVDDGEDGLEVWTDAVASEYRMLISRGRCPGGRNARTGRAHRVLWAYPGVWEPWAADEWRTTNADSAPNWLDRNVERMIAATTERKAR
jgi:hypothetical protein